MRKLIEFIVRHQHWLLFLFLETVAFVVLFNDSIYHRAQGMAVANALTGRINSLTGEVRSYMSLREKNRMLLDANARLELEYISLKRAVDAAVADSVRPLLFRPDSLNPQPVEMDYLRAQVVNASYNRVENFMTIDKGRADGVLPEMGVVSATGVVGAVTAASDHYAIVIPIINPKFKLSCRLKGSEYVGSILWEKPGSNVAQLTDLPRHVQLAQGDTVVTSGYSSIFPANLMVGRVGKIKGKDTPLAERNSFSAVPVILSADFGRLTDVYVILNKIDIERQKLEEENGIPKTEAY
ncbi:rod shape-determining protein MreC [Porphyromonas gingivalis]|uniref:Cell shape-determining protein MreC n=12 Tax=Porphyromonas gingivalis TaxID=837 RepID=Q7MUT7_PORGI|nr:rod shape-determining protein MreC [Porphyromonas gingivalis]AAQ66455.1 cell shape-determining protein MreC, putative [Porphyromonas gingivalis W83]AIJ35969.1 rod shape-determining protein MreC [Porphyromonas gingivalis]AKV63786.1 cell shape-determining protein [Porphyromonas gingivalis]ALA93116.1 cell shape-determining protein [Porphyromonas gingivalis AJW4]ALJ25299.1 cell shape-determining protein [Porphyromonas gingivalis 381]